MQQILKPDMKKPFSITILLVLLSAFGLWGQGKVLTFDNPKLTVYLPSNPGPASKAVIACPGGGYTHLAKDHEGHNWAHFYNNLGFAYAVLEYTMPNCDREMLLGEVESAFKILVDNAADWKINPEKIGIMGSSAGGHLAATVATHPRGVMKPAFQVLFYPVVSLDPEITHLGTRAGFVGKDADKELTAEWSSENKVTPETCPAFMALSSDDKAVNPLNSLRYMAALCKAGVPVALFSYPTGGHGWGYRTTFKYHDQVLAELTAWLNTL